MVELTYHVTAEIDGRFWLVRVLELDRATQARSANASDALRADEARARAEAAQEVRQAAKTLHETGIPLRDVGTVLGVSHQRAHQLVKSAGTARLWPPPDHS